MNKVLLIGAGGVGSVVAHKCAMVPEVFGEITLASRTVSKCDAIAAEVKKRTGREIATARVDADDPVQTAELIRKTDRIEFDTVLEIGRDGMKSNRGEFTDLRDMHFGRTSCLGEVKRSKWAADHVERALVYCAGEHCIAIPFVCRNVSLVTMKSLHDPYQWPAEMPRQPRAEEPSLPYFPRRWDLPYTPKDDTVRTVPEPSTYALVLAALAGMAMRRKPC
jgi:hypothetical protein